MLYKLNGDIKKKTSSLQALIKKIYFIQFVFYIALYHQQTTNTFLMTMQ
jgi:hypothetical protein